MNHRIIHVPADAAGMRLSVWMAKNGYPVTADCGGKGTCGKCRVALVRGTFWGDAAKTTYETPDADGMIRSCHAWCSDEGADILITETIGGGLTDFASADSTAPDRQAVDAVGAALDIGTTTLALALVDLNSGKVLSTVSRRNPQRSFGADVMSRIGAAAADAENLRLMQQVLLDEIHSMLQTLIGPMQTMPRIMTVAGNTTMLHVFCGISPAGMGAYPFTPEFLDAKHFSGDDLGLPVDRIVVLPGAHAFIGGDITAGMLYLHLTENKEPVMLVDIGTNGEMVLFTGTEHGGLLYAASAAAGPALEGAGISTGVGGIAGAVCAVMEGGTHLPGGLAVRTIDDKPPIGICGSGLIDLAAVLLARGDLDETGCLEDEPYAYAETAEHTLLQLTQEDIRALQLAKSALRAGMEALCDAAGLSLDSLSCVYIAGGLGYYMNMDNAAAIGLLPASLRTRLQSVGNTALGGAALLLSDLSLLSRMSTEAAGCRTVDLNRSAAFNELFIEHMMFPSDEEDE